MPCSTATRRRPENHAIGLLLRMESSRPAGRLRSPRAMSVCRPRAGAGPPGARGSRRARRQVLGCSGTSRNLPNLLSRMVSSPPSNPLFHAPPAAFDLQQLLVAPCDVLGRQVRVAGTQQASPVELGVRGDLRSVDAEQPLRCCPTNTAPLPSALGTHVDRGSGVGRPRRSCCLHGLCVP